MPISEHYRGSGEKVMKSMAKTYKDPETRKRVFYATEQKMKRKMSNRRSMKSSR